MLKKNENRFNENIFEKRGKIIDNFGYYYKQNKAEKWLEIEGRLLCIVTAILFVASIINLFFLKSNNLSSAILLTDTVILILLIAKEKTLK